MEVDVMVSIQAVSSSQKRFLKTMLGDDKNRPLDEEDLPEDQQGWFEPMDLINPADVVKGLSGNRVHAFYTLGGDWDENLDDLLAALAEIEVRDAYAVVVGDEGWFQLWVQRQGQTEQHDEWQGRSLDALFSGRQSLGKVLDKLRESAGA